MFNLSKRSNKILKKSAFSGAILAIKVPKDIIKKIKPYVDEETMPSKDLHITLVYLGKAKDINDLTRKAIIKVAEKVCSNHEPLSMYISGAGKFTKGEDGTPIYFVPNAKGLSNLQADLENNISNVIELNSEHGWVPHITIQYSTDKDPEVPPVKNFPKWKANDIILLAEGKQIAKIPIGKKKASFNISKRAMQVIIEPWDNAVDKAMKIIQSKDPGLLKNVKKIVVHPGTGSGQLGHVEMGTGKDPQEIHVFKDRIKQIVTQQAGGTKTTLTTDELESAIVNGIIETISHEIGHIGPQRTVEQIQTQPFLGEPEAERESKTFMSKIQMAKDVEIKDSDIHGDGLFAKKEFEQDDYIAPALKDDYNKSKELEYINHSKTPNAEIAEDKDGYGIYALKKINKNDEITIDYDETDELIKVDKDFDRDSKIKLEVKDLLNDALTFLSNLSEKLNVEIYEPDLKFVSNMESKYTMTKNAFKIKKSIYNEIIDAIDYNKNVMLNKKALQLLGIIDHYIDLNIDENFIVRLSKWQKLNKLDITGKLDNKTLNKFAERKINNFPRNFSIVVPGKLYRGGKIDSIEQLKNLKDLGVKQVVSLHASPEVIDMCDKLNLIHIPAYIENGYKNELGMTIFGDSVSKILDKFITYVHCFFGEDRTGAVIARYRVEKGWPCDLAYKEAKSFGFKDMFADLIDWFSEPCGKPPINTDKIRKVLKYENPYSPPEQECSIPSPISTDDPYSGFPGYSENIREESPVGLLSIPVNVEGH